MAFDSRIEYAQVQKIPMDLECHYDLITGRGIRLQSVESFNKKNEKVYDGLQSEFFGSDFSEEQAFRERWACKCKKYIGKAHQGYLCEQCGTVVEYSDIDLTKTGWIILDHFSIMSPIYMAKLSDALGTFEGEKVLDKIFAMEYRDAEAPVEYNEKDLIAMKKHPFIKRGMQWLYENLNEVIDYYAKKKPSKAKLFAELRNEYDNIWTHSLPVYTALLRTELPGEKGSKNFKLKANTQYQAIIKLVNAINHVEPEDFNPKTLNTIDIELAAIQREIDKIFLDTYKDLTDKSGILIGRVLGGKYNFSARNIIVPSSGRLRSDEIEIGYVPFMELYRYEIINYYAKIKGCTIMEASNVWKKGTNHFDPVLYAIMEFMVTNEECKKYMWTLISRNPCINYGSFICVRIVYVKPDIAEKTLTIPSHDIIPMNADWTLRQGREVWQHASLYRCERLISGVYPMDMLTVEVNKIRVGSNSPSLWKRFKYAS